jgi:hypothetical protein
MDFYKQQEGVHLRPARLFLQALAAGTNKFLSTYFMTACFIHEALTAPMTGYDTIYKILFPILHIGRPKTQI